MFTGESSIGIGEGSRVKLMDKYKYNPQPKIGLIPQDMNLRIGVDPLSNKITRLTVGRVKP